MSWIQRLKFKDGLIPVITQDYKTGEILMLAYMNKDSLKRTLKTKMCTYYSRSRKKVWVKGETSGHIQRVKSMFVDCDMDSILIKIEQAGGACHTGYKSCFYREAVSGRLRCKGKKVFDPKKVY